MQQIWRRAIEALLKADSVEVWGYSLPESDLAVRAILSPLRSRLFLKSTSVAVHDPSKEVQVRWLDFLSDSAKIDATPLGHSAQ